MNFKNIAQTLVSAATLLGVNAIPAGVVLAWGKSTQTGMVLYFLETVLSIMFTVAFVLLRAPAEDAGYAAIASTRTTQVTNGRTVNRYQAGNRRSLIEGFLLFSFGFGVIPAIFLGFWIFVVAHVDLAWSAVGSALSGIFAIQLINLVVDLIVFPKVTPDGASSIINQSMGRVAVIYVSVFAGLIIAMLFSVGWFILPFAILKTLADLSFLIRRNSAIQSQAI